MTNAQQQTFSGEHWERVVSQFAGCLDTATLRILYRASNSETFSADLRSLIEEVVKPEALA